MEFLGTRSSASERHQTMRHDLVIGPLCDSALFGRKARVYYSIRCKWSFLVSGSKVAVLDEWGKPLVGDESFGRFSALERDHCPVLEAFALESLAETLVASAMSLGGSHEFSTAPHSFLSSALTAVRTLTRSGGARRLVNPPRKLAR